MVVKFKAKAVTITNTADTMTLTDHRFERFMTQIAPATDAINSRAP